MSAKLKVSIILWLALIFAVSHIASQATKLAADANAMATLDTMHKEKIAFVSYRDGYPNIYIMNSDGSDQQPLNKSEPQAYSDAPTWSPDGKQIVFSVYYDNSQSNPTKIYITDLSGTHQLSIATFGNSDSAFPKWSPDGKRIAFTSNSDGLTEIYLMGADGLNQSQITQGDDVNPKNNYDVQWSPDGKYLGFVSEGVHDITTASIDVIQPDGSNHRSIILNPKSQQTFSWSPDGKEIAYVSTHDKLCVANLDNKITHCFSNIGNCLGPTWSPDGTHIAISAKVGKGYDIYNVDVQSGNLDRLTNSDGSDSLNVQWSPDGTRLVYIVDQDNYKPSVYTIDLATKQAQRLTDNTVESESPVWEPNASS
jgi:Tol biopolymer transport system component